MINRQRVLVVDELTETQEVLQTILGPRGLSVDRRNTTDTTYGRRPDLIVIDADSAVAELTGDRHWPGVPQVIISSEQLDHGTVANGNANGNCYLQKPFQYPELIHAIEKILALYPKPTAQPS